MMLIVAAVNGRIFQAQRIFFRQYIEIVQKNENNHGRLTVGRRWPEDPNFQLSGKFFPL